MGRPYDAPRPFDDPRYNYGGQYIGPVGSDPDEIAADCYALAPQGFAVLCTVAYSYDSGRAYDDPRMQYDGTTQDFRGLLDTADEDFFNAGSRTTHTLRFLAGPPIKAGDQITAEGVTYTVTGIPRRINADELQAGLVRNT